MEDHIIKDFKKFVKVVCKWVKIKIFPQVGGYKYCGNDEDKFGNQHVTLSERAIDIVRQWGSSVLCGFGAYSVQEVVFRAGRGIYAP